MTDSGGVSSTPRLFCSITGASEYWIARSSRAMTVGVWRVLVPSLRANGSRECAPDDRLREAIHVAAKLKSGLLRRFHLRSLSYGEQVAPRNAVGLISNMPPHSRGAICPSFCKNRSPRKRGRRECRAPDAPKPSRQKGK